MINLKTLLEDVEIEIINSILGNTWNRCGIDTRS